MDTDYLKSTIGNALSEGCAATALAHPPDPVDFLSSWLVQYARNKSIRADMAEEKREELERERLANERAEAEEREKKDKEMWREMGLERVVGFSDDAWLMWSRALEEARKHTGQLTNLLVNLCWLAAGRRLLRRCMEEEGKD